MLYSFLKHRDLKFFQHSHQHNVRIREIIFIYLFYVCGHLPLCPKEVSTFETIVWMIVSAGLSLGGALKKTGSAPNRWAITPALIYFSFFQM